LLVLPPRAKRPSGKTAVAIELAKHLDTEIISADSRQCYKELNIGVARPSPVELATVNHHFIASHSIHEKVDVAVFEQYALEKAAAIFSRRPVAVVVGGTGLYIKALCEGIDDMPPIPEAVKAHVSASYKRHGLQWLQQEVERLDPDFFSGAEIFNPHRLMRALELRLASGKSVLELRQGKKAKRDFEVIKLALDLPRPELKERINKRVDQMVAAGLVEEAKHLVPFRHLNALQTVGYKELFSYFDGLLGLEEAVEQIKTNTRQYAKRQLTWFRKDEAFEWVNPQQVKQRFGFA